MKNANLDNISWFVGVVENNYDQRLEGRVQVRAFGVHGTIDDIPTADLPWAMVATTAGYDFSVIPLNSWVIGMFIDGRDAQQPIIMGVLRQQYLEPINPGLNGWGVALGKERDRLAQGTRPQDFGQPPISRLARGENLEETYLLSQETNRVRGVGISGEGSDKLHSAGNLGVTARDDSERSMIASSTSEHDIVNKAVPHIIQIESNWDATARNPSSSAAGLGQFIDSTWLTMIRKHRPDVAAGKSESELIALKMDAKLSYEMTVRYTENNHRYLTSKGVAVDEGALYLAHFLGPAGAVKALSGSANQPLADLVSPRVITANRGITHNGKSFANFTVADIRSWSNKKMTGEVTGSAPSGNYVAKATTWDEPSTAYNAQYPYNRVIETASGHTMEMDDTPGAERVMIRDRSGAYIQMASTTTTYKSPHDVYDVNERNVHVYVGGAQTVTIKGDCHLKIEGNRIDEVMGDYRLIVHGSHEASVAGTLNLNGGDETNIRGARVSMESNVENTNIKVGRVLRLETTETIHFKTKNMFLTTDETLNITAGTDLLMKGGNIKVAADSGLFLAGAETIDAKAEQVRVGGGQKVHLNASTVVMDDVIRMAEGASEEPETLDQEPIAAEPATPVFMRSPTTKGIAV